MGTVTLENAASSAGARIELSAGDPSIIVPADISVPAGSKSATFPVTTSAVNGYVDTPVAATLNGITRSVLIHLSPPPVIGLVSMLKTPVKGGESVAVHVQFFPNPGFAGINGFNVALSSNNPAAMVPTSLVIQNGLGGANAVVTTSSVTRETTVLISASGGGVTLSTILTIQP